MMDPEDKFLHNLRKSEQTRHQEPSHKAWERIQHVLETKKKKRKIKPMIYWQQIAATFLLICFLSVIYYFLFRSPMKLPIAQSKEKQISVPPTTLDSSQESITMMEETKIPEVKPESQSNRGTFKAKKTTPIKDESAADIAYESQGGRTANTADKNVSTRSTKAKEQTENADATRMTSAPSAAIQLAYTLFPPDAAGKWAGKYNGKNYSASLKSSGTDWELAGFYVSGVKRTERFLIGEQVLRYSNYKGSTNYTYEGLDGKQVKYSNPKDPKDFFMMSYEKDRIFIYQYGKASTTPINTWVLIKSYE